MLYDSRSETRLSRLISQLTVGTGHEAGIPQSAGFAAPLTAKSKRHTTLPDYDASTVRGFGLVSQGYAW